MQIWQRNKCNRERSTRDSLVGKQKYYNLPLLFLKNPLQVIYKIFLNHVRLTEIY